MLVKNPVSAPGPPLSKILDPHLLAIHLQPTSATMHHATLVGEFVYRFTCVRVEPIVISTLQLYSSRCAKLTCCLVHLPCGKLCVSKPLFSRFVISDTKRSLPLPSDTPYIMFFSAQKYKICSIKNILAFLICKTCSLCIFISKSSSNTMGFQLFNVLSSKVGGTRPVTGLTVQ